MSDEKEYVAPCPHCGHGIPKVTRAYVLIDPEDLSVYEAYPWEGKEPVSDHSISKAIAYEGEIRVTGRRVKIED